MARSGKPKKYFIGIDEAGRGPLAGPVAVGVVGIIGYESRVGNKNNGWFKNLKDSKKLSEKSREEWFVKIKKANRDGWLQFAVAFGGANLIDKKGIVFTTHDAMERALRKLGANPKETLALLDGALKAPPEYVYQKTIIKGDEKEPIISLASIVAKVSRDRLMKKIAQKYPRYGFEKHKGYGTRSHYQKIEKNGLSPIHRKSFTRRIVKD